MLNEGRDPLDHVIATLDLAAAHALTNSEKQVVVAQTKALESMAASLKALEKCGCKKGKP